MKDEASKIDSLLKYLEVDDIDSFKNYFFENGKSFTISSGSNYLHLAALYDSYTVFHFLLFQGLDLKLTNQFSATPLIEAARGGGVRTADLITLLIRSQVNIQDVKGRIPVMYAIKNKNHEMIKLLMERGSDSDIEDSNGYNSFLWLSKFLTAEELKSLFSAEKLEEVKSSIKQSIQKKIEKKENVEVNVELVKVVDDEDDFQKSELVTSVENEDVEEVSPKELVKKDIEESDSFVPEGLSVEKGEEPKEDDFVQKTLKEKSEDEDSFEKEELRERDFAKEAEERAYQENSNEEVSFSEEDIEANQKEASVVKGDGPEIIKEEAQRVKSTEESSTEESLTKSNSDSLGVEVEESIVVGGSEETSDEEESTSVVKLKSGAPLVEESEFVKAGGDFTEKINEELEEIKSADKNVVDIEKSEFSKEDKSIDNILMDDIRSEDKEVETVAVGEFHSVDRNLDEDLEDIKTVDKNLTEELDDIKTVDKNIGDELSEIKEADKSIGSEEFGEIKTVDKNLSGDIAEIRDSDKTIKGDELGDIKTVDKNLSDELSEIKTTDKSIDEEGWELKNISEEEEAKDKVSIVKGSPELEKESVEVVKGSKDEEKESSEVISGSAENKEEVQVVKEIVQEETSSDKKEVEPENYEPQTEEEKEIEKDLSLNINKKNKKGQSLCFITAQKGLSDMLKKLIAKGADIESRDMKGISPLMIAAKNGHVECIEILCDNSKNIDAKSTSGHNALVMAVEANQAESIRVLVNRGADINFKLKGNNLLMHAASLGKMGAVKNLVLLGLNIAEKNFRGQTAIDIAKKAKHKKVVFLLTKLLQATQGKGE